MGHVAFFFCRQFDTSRVGSYGEYKRLHLEGLSLVPPLIENRELGSFCERDSGIVGWELLGGNCWVGIVGRELLGGNCWAGIVGRESG